MSETPFNIKNRKKNEKKKRLWVTQKGGVWHRDRRHCSRGDSNFALEPLIGKKRPRKSPHHSKTNNSRI